MSKEIEKLSFTNNQKTAIEHDGSDIVVSASAGAGKTAVLIEYIFRKVALDKNVSISDILAMTFTDAAAQSMKKKLFQRMNQSLTEEEIKKGYDEEHLKKQAELLPSADICTIDSFCTNLLNQYCYVIGWDPNRPKTVLDKNTVDQLKKDVAHKLVIEKLKNNDKTLYDMVSAYSSNGNNTNVFENLLVEVGDSLDKYVDEEAWYKIVEEYYSKDTIENLDEKYIERFYSKISQTSKVVANDLTSYLDEIKYMDMSVEKIDVKGYISNLIEQYSNIENLANKKDNDAIEAISNLEKISTAATLFGGKNKNDSIETEALKNEHKEIYESYLKFLSKKLTALKEYAVQYRDFSNQNKDLQPKIKIFLELLKEYRKQVDERKAELNGIDFVDMEKAAIQILKNKDIAERLRKKYKYILIDEYQDSNDIQEALVQLICRKDKGNVFRVGDVKQSIYGFRSAKPELMRSIVRNAKKDEMVVFEDNFRSSDIIVQFNNILYKTIMNIPGFNDTYTDGIDVAKAGSNKQHICKEKCEVYLLGSKDEESESRDKEKYIDQSHFIVSKIKKMREESIKKKEELKNEWKDLDKGELKQYFYDHGIYADWKDYVILVRNHDYKKIMQNAFDAYEVPVFFITNKGYYDDVAVQTVISWLKWISNIDDTIAMYSVLTSPFYEWSNNKMAENYLSFKEAESNNIRKYIFENNTKINKDYEYLKNTYDKDGLIALIREIFNLDDYFNTKTTVEQRDNLSLFFEKCIGVYDRYSSLETLLDWLAISKKADDGTATSVSESSDVVRIITIHNSKGLEYPVVFYVGNTLCKKGKEKGRYRIDEKLGLALEVYKMPYQVNYKPVLWNIINDMKYMENVEEEIRLMYVATTRAMSKLIIVGFESDDKVIFEQGYIERIAGDVTAIGNIIKAVYENNESEMSKYCNIIPVSREDIERGEFSEEVDSVEFKVKKYNSAIKGYEETSPSALEKKKMYPISYKEKTDSALRGTLIHKAYEQLDFKNPKVEGLDIPLDEQDKKKIMNFFDHDIGKKIANMDNIIHELPYALLEDGIYMHGFMDLVAMNDKEIILVDYKSDLNKTEEELIEDYQNQQKAYRKALEHLNLPVTCYLYALELNEFIEIK